MIKTRASRRNVFTMCALVAVIGVVLVLGCAGPIALNSASAAATSGGAAGGTIVFNGTGRAHGVGMCMDGVHYRSLAGQDYHAILNYYYTGVTLSKTDDSRPIRVKGRDGQIRTWTMHDYLYHLQEEPNDSPMEELKCLYVAARTYALSCIARNKHTAQGFDVCSSGECCQACDENKNFAAYPNNNKAVDDTAGEIITYNGQPITAAYCGSCGGHTENNEDVWSGTPIPYLRGKPDDFCKNSPRFAWKITMAKSDLEAKLNSNPDTTVGVIYGIDLSDRTPGGRVRKARITGSSATRTISGGTLQSLIGGQSTKFDQAACNFDEYLLVQNPGSGAAAVTFTFIFGDGNTSEQKVSVPANSRYTMLVNDYAQFQEVSAKVSSDVPIIAERSMYFNYRSVWNGGTDAVGATTTHKDWYFAEGTTRPNFDAYITMQNPGGQAAAATLDYMIEGSGLKSFPVNLPASCRVTVHVADQIGAYKDFSVKVSSSSPIVAERPMYFNYHGKWDGGHDVVGINNPSKSFYFAEGATYPNFEEYLCLQNPGAQDITVNATYMLNGGETVDKSYAVPANQRKTVSVNNEVGVNRDVSVALTSSGDFVAERPMYFNYSGKKGLSYTGGHDVIGVTQPAKQFNFAEGYTGPGFDQWLCIQNPNDTPATLDITYLPQGGAPKKTSHVIAPKSRGTVFVNEDAGENLALSTSITSDVPVVVERPMYFVYKGSWTGGHDSSGASTAMKTWYFAEGYTGN